MLTLLLRTWNRNKIVKRSLVAVLAFNDVPKEEIKRAANAEISIVVNNRLCCQLDFLVTHFLWGVAS